MFILKGLIKLMIGNLSYDEDSLMDRALLETYAKKDITPDADLSKIEPQIMSDLEQILEGMEGGNDLALRLRKYIKTLPEIDCYDDKGNKKVCTTIPEVIYVYLTGRY